MSQYDFKTPNICTVRGERKGQRKGRRRERERREKRRRQSVTESELSRETEAETLRKTNGETQTAKLQGGRKKDRDRERDKNTQIQRWAEGDGRVEAEEGNEGRKGTGNTGRERGACRTGWSQRPRSVRGDRCVLARGCEGSRQLGRQLGGADAGDPLGPGSSVRGWLGVGAARQGVSQAGVEGEGALDYRGAGQRWRSKGGPSD